MLFGGAVGGGLGVQLRQDQLGALPVPAGGGGHVHPAQQAAMLLALHPAVVDVVVKGVPHADPIDLFAGGADHPPGGLGVEQQRLVRKRSRQSLRLAQGGQLRQGGRLGRGHSQTVRPHKLPHQGSVEGIVEGVVELEGIGDGTIGGGLLQGDAVIHPQGAGEGGLQIVLLLHRELGQVIILRALGQGGHVLGPPPGKLGILAAPVVKGPIGGGKIQGRGEIQVLVRQFLGLVIELFIHHGVDIGVEGVDDAPAQPVYLHRADL